MRVVAGEARGRRLAAPPGIDTRPTLDRVREALFNALGSLDAVEGARVLDLFAGSGALGIEALSRGAVSCTFVERSAPARRIVQANLECTGLAGRARIVGGDARRFLAEASDDPTGGRFDLVLLDPPYATDDEEWSALLHRVGTVAAGGVAVLESDRPVPLPDAWDVLREKRYGDTLVLIARTPCPPPEPS